MLNLYESGINMIDTAYTALYEHVLTNSFRFNEKEFKEQQDDFLELLKEEEDDILNEFSVIEESKIDSFIFSSFFEQYKLFINIAMDNNDLTSVFGVLTRVLDELVERVNEYSIEHSNSFNLAIESSSTVEGSFVRCYENMLIGSLCSLYEVENANGPAQPDFFIM